MVEIIPTSENIVPVGKRYLVDAFKQAEETTAGLVISQGDGNATSVFGTVIRVGDIDCRWPVGAKLLWRRYSLDNLKLAAADGEHEYALIDESEIIAEVVSAPSGLVGPPSSAPARAGDYSAINELKHASKETASVEEGEDSGKEADGQEGEGILASDNNNTMPEEEVVVPEGEAAETPEEEAPDEAGA